MMSVTSPKGTVQNKKYHNLWKKSKRGGRGQGQNKKSLHFKCRLTLTEGGVFEFFRFFPNSNKGSLHKKKTEKVFAKVWQSPVSSGAFSLFFFIKLIITKQETCFLPFQSS